MSRKPDLPEKTEMQTPDMPQMEPTRRRPAERKQELLEAASKVFSEKGFHGATTAEIAREAGVAEGTIFRYFKTKKDILISLIGTIAVDALTSILIRSEGKTDQELLLAFMENNIRFFRKNLDVIRLLLYEAQFHEDVRSRFVEEVATKINGIIETYIRKRVANGAFRSDINPQIAARAFLGMFASFVIWTDVFKMPAEESRSLETLVDIFLNGVRNRPQPL